MHISFLQHCHQLAEEALQHGNAPVGSLLVYHNQIISEAAEAATSSGEVTQHAEILAVLKAVPLLQKEQWKEVIMYTTHEPCIMCAYVIRHYGIGTIVIENSVPHAGGHPLFSRCSSQIFIPNGDLLLFC